MKGEAEKFFGMIYGGILNQHFESREKRTQFVHAYLHDFVHMAYPVNALDNQDVEASIGIYLNNAVIYILVPY